MRFTITGSQGMIGSRLSAYLGEQGHEVHRLTRETPVPEDCGHVIHCAGVTGDFLDRPLDTMFAHVGMIEEILRNWQFESVLYLSSTRLYRGVTDTAEDAPLRVEPGRADDLYNISKLAGEAVCLAIDHPGVRVARLAHVCSCEFSSENFLDSLVRDAMTLGKIVLSCGRETRRDCILLDDVIALLSRIAVEGRHRIYNVASGTSINVGRIVEIIQRNTGCAVDWPEANSVVKGSAPEIDTRRIREEFAFKPARLEDHLGSWLCARRAEVAIPGAGAGQL